MNKTQKQNKLYQRFSSLEGHSCKSKSLTESNSAGVGTINSAKYL